MATSQTAGGGFSVSTGPLMAGAALMGVGAMFGLAGLALSGSALIRGARQWVQEMDMPPSEVARAKWAQAKAATTAGASAWQNGLTAQGRR